MNVNVILNIVLGYLWIGFIALNLIDKKYKKYPLAFVLVYPIIFAGMVLKELFGLCKDCIKGSK